MGVSLLAIGVLPHRYLPFTLDVGRVAEEGSPYLHTHVREAAASVAIAFVGALAMSLLMYKSRAWRTPAEFRSQGSVWVHSLGSRPAGKVPYVGLHLEDGRLLEGRLHSFTLDAEAAVTANGGTAAQDLPHLNRIIVDADKIVFVTVIHAPAGMVSRRWLKRRPD
jgi:hypothetical protein